MADPLASATSGIVAVWESTSREHKVGVAVLLALGLWSLYRYLTDPSSSSASDPGADPVKSDDGESLLSSDAADDLRVAAERYGADYRARMKATTVVPRAESGARPFIGFSLADNIKDGALVVDGVFAGGPADQTGVDIDHELLSINGEAATSIDVVRELVAKHCRAGQVTRMTLRTSSGDDGDETSGRPAKSYEVLLWVMTADARYRGKPYFFDTNAHHVRQSDRHKQAWSSTSPHK